MLQFALSLVLAYLVGSIPFGYLVFKWRTGRDIRAEGSGNIGATNVLRILGKRAGATVLLCDALKGALAAAAGIWLHARGAAPAGLHTARETAALLGLVAILGHTFPVWLRFRGGKGVATALGVFLVVGPAAILAVVALFLALVAATRIVSLGSIAGALALPPLVHRLYPGEPRVLAVAVAVAAVVLVLHRSNFARLMRGTEKRLGAKTEPPESGEPRR